jgi:hypothetical protein
VVTNFVTGIKQRYGKIGEVKVKRGKVHDYLGMRLHYDAQGQVSIDMVNYVQNMLDFHKTRSKRRKRHCGMTIYSS